MPWDRQDQGLGPRDAPGSSQEGQRAWVWAEKESARVEGSHTPLIEGLVGEDHEPPLVAALELRMDISTLLEDGHFQLEQSQEDGFWLAFWEH